MPPTESEAPVREGDILAGKYRVERVLGVGGMGVVVAATHIELDQKVAIKFVLPAAVKDEALLERFLREARASVRLKSEHVAKVLDVGKMESGAPYMVMEFLEGCDLGALIARDGPLPVETAADYVAQACEAVAEAHSQGIIHRDIKPQNLFLTKRVGGASLVKVLDFGVSKVSIAGVQNLTQTMTVMGSPLYMSPEQMRSAKSVDPRSDIWALGVVLYELLTARLPFHAESMPELCLKVVTEPAPPVNEARGDIPTELAAVVMRCLEKDPDKRFADAGELATALENFVTPGSRLSIERARMVMSGMRRPSSSLPAATAVSATQRTPPPWTGSHAQGAGTGSAAGTRQSKGALVAIGAAVAGALVIGGVLFFLRGSGSSSDARAPASPPAAAAGTSSQVTNVAPPPALTLAPAATSASADPATSAPLPSASASVAARPSSPYGGAALPLPPAKPSAKGPAKPNVRDDDIPAMR